MSKQIKIELNGWELAALDFALEKAIAAGDIERTSGEALRQKVYDAGLKGSFIVSVYFCERVYGGPEEGGWWYNTGEPVTLEGIPSVSRFDNEDDAQAARELLQARLDATVNVGLPPLSSVASDGLYFAQAERAEKPQAYPQTTPHYE